jgi:HAD superfamily hydrolase (TIGR01458 family)
MKSFLIDLDGVLYVGKKPVEGARECLERLDELGYDYRFVSNSTRRCSSSVAERLEEFGYHVLPQQIFTPPLAAIQRIKRSKKNRCFLLSIGDVHLEFENAGISLRSEDVDFVIVGDAGQNFTFDRLNLALRLILDGAEILALEQDRYWQESDGLVLSTGPFVAALEYATGKKAVLMGKPSSEFFEMALKDMKVRPDQAAMIGDDILTDVDGAQRLGMKGILVKTGKYREDLARDSGVAPDLVLDSLAQLVNHL